MLFIRQSFGRLVEGIGTNSFHYGTRGISKTTNSCLYATSYHLATPGKIHLATPGKLPWTVSSLSHRFWASDSASIQGLEKKSKQTSEKKIEVETCQHCGTGFANKDALRSHIDKTGKGNAGCQELRRIKNKEDVLAGIRPHVCKECGYGFKRKDNLNDHMHVHSDKRSIVCTHCSKTFKSKKDLLMHIQDNHSGQSFPCPKCNKLFSHASSMGLHLKTVCSSGAKEFKCGHCGKEFSRKDHLDQHITRFHQ